MGLGFRFGVLDASWGALGRSWDLFGRFWAISGLLGAFLVSLVLEASIFSVT